jgi:hypothetical protein
MRFFTSFGTLVVLLVVGLFGILGEAAGALLSICNKKLNTLVDVRRA